MRRLVRKEWRISCYEYELEIDTEFIDRLNRIIAEDYILESEEPVTLTETDVIKAWERYYEDENSTLNRKVLGIKYYDGTEHIYSYNVELGEVLADILNDMMWEQDYNEIESNTDDVYDTVEEN